MHVALTIGGNLATIAGLMAALWFNYRVFHDGQRSGRSVAGVASLLMWIGFAVYVQAGGMKGADLYGRASWPYVASMVLGDLWLISDALRFRSQLLRRLAFGMAEPLVVDRLLLWSVASLARVALVLIAPLTSLLDRHDDGAARVARVADAEPLRAADPHRHRLALADALAERGLPALGRAALRQRSR